MCIVIFIDFFIITDNIASESFVSQNPRGSTLATLAIDGITTTCSKIKGLDVAFQVDLKAKSIVTGVYILFGGMLVNDV